MHKVIDTIHQLRQCRDLDEVHETTCLVLARYGLEHYFVTRMLRPGVDASEDILASSLDDEFLHWYSCHDNSLLDPRLAIGRRRLEAFVWSEAMDLSRQPIMAQRIYSRLDKAGMTDAITVPVRTLGGLEGTASFGGGSVELSAAQRGELTLFGIALHEQLRKLLPAKTPVLSSRMRDVLRLGAMGMTSQDISDTLGITKRTVDMHFKEAVRALDSVTRIQAVSRAYRMQLFDLDERRVIN